MPAASTSPYNMHLTCMACGTHTCAKCKIYSFPPIKNAQHKYCSMLMNCALLPIKQVGPLIAHSYSSATKTAKVGQFGSQIRSVMHGEAPSNMMDDVCNAAGVYAVQIYVRQISISRQHRVGPDAIDIQIGRRSGISDLRECQLLLRARVIGKPLRVPFRPSCTSQCE